MQPDHTEQPVSHDDEATASGPSRRRFLGLVAAGSSAVVLGTAIPVTIDLLGGTSVLDLLTATEDTFRPHVGTSFLVKTSPRQRITLTSVTTFGPRSFNLGFQGSAVLAQETYRLVHAALGTFDLFVVPRRPSGSPFGCDAVFNHEVL